MKKMIIAFLVLLCVTSIGVYILLPDKIDLNEIIMIKVNGGSVSRFLIDENKWNKWWLKKYKRNEQADTTHIDTNYTYKNVRYFVSLKSIWGDSIMIKNCSTTINSVLHVIPFNRDSSALRWRGQSAATSNPFKRFKNYLAGKKIRGNVEELLQSMKAFLENEENLYGIHIDQIQVKDTLLVATKYSSKTYPGTVVIYDLIRNLKNYISEAAAKETNYPMLHVTADSGSFNTMVAIPVNKFIPTNGNFLFKRMVPGKILVTEVKGGKYTTAEALKQLEMYLNDNYLQSPAIPFESLVTDRTREPDTSKWITKIYYPIY